MPDDTSLRKHLVELLKGGNAHATFDQAVENFPFEKAGVRPDGCPHSAWELLEHLRLAQDDILRFSRSSGHQSPPFPKGYWPSSPTPENAQDWNKSAGMYREDLAVFKDLIRDSSRDLHEAFPWGDGQTLLREALLLADHNAYHIGQLILVRRLAGAWNGR